MSYPIFGRGPPAPALIIRPEKKRDPQLSSKWSRFAASWLRRNPFCAECRRRGRDVLAAVLDHIVPRRHGGAMWDLSNLQGLCRSCDLGVKRPLEQLAVDLGDVQLLCNWMKKPEMRPSGYAFVAVNVEPDDEPTR